jgi:hypothetical protein
MDQFPRQDVIDCIGDLDLQKNHPWQCEPLDQRNWMARLRDQAISDGASLDTHWLYFTSPDSTWMNECGTEGWLLIDYLDLKQHEYIERAMS